MERAERWKNLGLEKETVFLTTTVQGFVKAFADPRIADIATVRILEDCSEYGVLLHSFVVMPEHIHVLLHLPDNMAVTTFANALKSKLALSVLPEMDAETKRLLRLKRTLKDRTFWQ